jgi:hypothetical protein
VLARKLRLTLRVSLLTGVPAMAFLGLGAQLALSAFGASYVHQATVPLRLLVLAYLPVIPRVHYIAVCRATGRTSRAAVVLTTAAVVEVGAAVAGGLAAGLNGLSLALLAVFIAEGVVTAPAVLRAARRPGRHRLSEPASRPGPEPAVLAPGRGFARAQPGQEDRVFRQARSQDRDLPQYRQQDTEERPPAASRPEFPEFGDAG